MKPQELRIGNCLFDPEENKNVLIEGVDLFLIQMDHPRESKYEPITLTEEILLKCGFEITKSNEYPFKYVINKGMRNEVEIENLNSTTCFTFSHGKRFSVLKIEYLHQLQNLYFSLTQQELKFKM